MVTRRSLLVIAGIGAGAIALPSAPARAAQTAGRVIDLPAPTSRQPVGTVDLHLVDRDRDDPLAPDRRPRELMVQLWYPALTTAGHRRAPYTTGAVAASLEAGLPLRPGTLAAVRPHARTGAPAVPGALPLVLLGHGRKGGRSNCTALAEELASYGYLVAALDHTYDAAVVEFPGGRAVHSVLPEESDDWDRQERLEIAARVGDLRFVATTLTRRRHGPRADPRRIGVAGHSMGGAAAAELLRVDERFAVGVNLDGALFGSPVADLGLDRPYLLLTALEDHDTWRRWREHQRGWGRQLRAGGTGHLTFTDLPHFAVPGGLAEAWPADLYAELLGTLAPARSTELIRTYTRLCFDRFLKGRPSPLLNSPSPRYPEVDFRWTRG
ncbi:MULTISPECIES: alpha/beta hydrolase [unclassified Streptomyces]|uniref:alpha/beta hydrolase family protein n=1 Tax=unclassified Streptomyces TaxID=2593676 RepID=UPI000DC7C6B4|nr:MULTISPECIES: alpha/beta hydrolase [unclassified Streptomyces]AWZ06760.1 alpha/beta hydrolase [Streptomyces sp. ICC4]AWZ15455.1 alpha/beta hydrolase [Streptomyces sp. ICC1]